MGELRFLHAIRLKWPAAIRSYTSSALAVLSASRLVFAAQFRRSIGRNRLVDCSFSKLLENGPGGGNPTFSGLPRDIDAKSRNRTRNSLRSLSGLSSHSFGTRTRLHRRRLG